MTQKPTIHDSDDVTEASYLMHQDVVEPFKTDVILDSLEDLANQRQIRELVLNSLGIPTKSMNQVNKGIAPGILTAHSTTKELKIKRLTDTAKLPTYAEPGAACADLFADEDILIPSKGWKAVKTGLAFELPPGFEAQIRARSGLALKFGLAILNGIGTIDSSYRGEIMAVIINHGSESYQVKKGDRIAQMKIEKATQWNFTEVDELTDTARGAGGFGSTGKN